MMRTQAKRPTRRLVLWLAAVAASLAALAAGSAVAAKNSRSHLRPVPELPNSSGFRSIVNMTQIISGGVPFSTSKDPGSSATPEGFTGSLQQGFVLASALRRYGALNAGLRLPLPLSFARQHPGPAEVFAYVWAFSNTKLPVNLLHSQDFMDSAVSGVSRLRSGTISDGLAWRIDSAANGGMSEFRFAWTKGGELIEVNVLGWKLSLSAARAVADRAGS
jgi:hypothetical protein